MNTKNSLWSEITINNIDTYKLVLIQFDDNANICLLVMISEVLKSSYANTKSEVVTKVVQTGIAIWMLLAEVV